MYTGFCIKLYKIYRKSLFYAFEKLCRKLVFISLHSIKKALFLGLFLHSTYNFSIVLLKLFAYFMRLILLDNLRMFLLQNK